MKSARKRFVLVGDLGGTSFRAAWADRRGRLSGLRSIPVPSPSTPRSVLSSVSAIFRTLCREAPGQARSISLSWKGLVDAKRGVSLHIGGFPGWVDIPVAARLEASLGLSVSIENDARCAAVGEGWLGRARGREDFAFVIVGTGIGTGLVRGGKPFRGGGGRAGEFGHTVLEPADRIFRCDCGAWGHWEALAAGPSLGRRAERELRAGASDLAAFRRKNPGPIDGRWVADALRAGCPTARRIVSETGRWLGIGLYNLIRVEDPSLVIVGGGASGLGERLLSPAREECRARLARFEIRPPPILATSLGDKAGLLGAAKLGWNE